MASKLKSMSDDDSAARPVLRRRAGARVPSVRQVQGKFARAFVVWLNGELGGFGVYLLGFIHSLILGAVMVG